ncbi:cytochrome P450 [Actinoplanes friuliensis]|uniref:Cytochrome P450 n=1 Tax=Actinoplanes friuliensis DSM 7358 TaxID=1246995 RepID=U5WA40_9ACTN|nr:cytochrome P450 [Actinoplanes friuliensis]AGZ44801.1 cytochrome P450 [Actinoplanes friuliensis DSM 7358]
MPPAETPLESQRKIARGDLSPGCPVHAGPDGVWHVQDFSTARAMLRSTETRQAGFGVEHAVKLEGRMRMPVLYRDGPEHREHRRQTAKYFTPKRVETAYRALMNRLADEQCAVLKAKGTADLSQLSFRLAVAVAAEVIGLTESGPGMARRLDRFFEEKDGTRLVRKWKDLRSNANMGLFYWRDVRPAIAARRAAPKDDLISHLLTEGCNNGEILGECVTFAAAGMVTTREFITLSAWHLFTDDNLRRSYTTGDDKERVAILHEILRLEPVVANLARWTTAEIEAGDVTIPAGARLDIGVAAANMDPDAVGADPGAVCPARPKADGVGDAGLSFGDGPHRCPGAYIAIQETDIFLTKLFSLPGLRMVDPPKVGIRAEIASYEITNLKITVN